MGYRKTRVVSRDYREAIRKQSDEHFVTCPNCKSRQLQKPDSEVYICTKCLKTFVIINKK